MTEPVSKTVESYLVRDDVERQFLDHLDGKARQLRSLSGHSK
jgi:hypothetical protein